MTQPAKIQIEQFYSHAPSAVWKGITDPALLARWWAQGDIKPVVGHRFELDMGKWGKQPCEVTRVQAERLIQFLFAAGTLDTLITFELIPQNGGTLLKLTHEGFNLDTPLGRTAYEGMNSGWPHVVKRLASALEGQ